VLDGQSEVQPMIATPAEETTPAVSPNGRWLAYDSDESGQFQIYVRPFPDVGGSRTQVSNGGGRDPVWSRDGRELFYWMDPGTIMGVTLDTDGTFSASRPRVIVKGDYVRDTGASPQYDVSLDGRRFLMVKPATADHDAAPPKVVIVQNWTEELKRLVPTK
jgi:hypothetical protein